MSEKAKPQMLDVPFKVLRLKKDDVIVVMSDSFLSNNSVAAIESSAKKHFPDHRVLVLDGGLKIGVIGKAGAATIEKAVRPKYETR